MDDKEFFVKMETSLAQALQENTLGVGVEYMECTDKDEVFEDIKIIKKLFNTNKDIIDTITIHSDIQREIIKKVLEKDSENPKFKNRIWTERWKTIPYYRKYVNEKWWKE